MGCTLYCLRFGRIPFEKHGMIELYQAIRMDKVDFDSDCNEDLQNLLRRLLEKDPKKRINIEELRVGLRRQISSLFSDWSRNTLGSHETAPILSSLSPKTSPS
jgi:serine/threonine protein kinase